MTFPLYADVACTITASVLLVASENSVDPTRAEIATVAAAIPHARTLALGGHEHAPMCSTPRCSPLSSCPS
jgi:hypothetical protein